MKKIVIENLLVYNQLTNLAFLKQTLDKKTNTLKLIHVQR